MIGKSMYCIKWVVRKSIPIPITLCVLCILTDNDNEDILFSNSYSDYNVSVLRFWVGHEGVQRTTMYELYSTREGFIL